MIEISKELLSEVYNFEVKDFVQLGTDDVIYEVRFNGLKNGTNYNIINIYELAHKCKGWALSKDYKLVSLSRECFLYDTQELYDVSEQLNQWSEWFEADSEIEAIIKACEWIIKEISK